MSDVSEQITDELHHTLQCTHGIDKKKGQCEFYDVPDQKIIVFE